MRGSASQAALDGLGAASGLGSQSHLLSWADRTFGQGLTTITKGLSTTPDRAARVNFDHSNVSYVG